MKNSLQVKVLRQVPTVQRYAPSRKRRVAMNPKGFTWEIPLRWSYMAPITITAKGR